ncbi:MAG: hypothetical protein WDN04_22815 [Rhodospirillales bacterium]
MNDTEDHEPASNRGALIALGVVAVLILGRAVAEPCAGWRGQRAGLPRRRADQLRARGAGQLILPEIVSECWRNYRR